MDELKVISPSAIDPVCGMTVDPAHAAGTAVHNGEEYYFCSKHCVAKFNANPEAFLSAAKVAAPVVVGATYTCPMHPEIRQDHPGACPKCGMGLEPVGGAALQNRLEYTCPMHPEVVSDHPGS